MTLAGEAAGISGRVVCAVEKCSNSPDSLRMGVFSNAKDRMMEGMALSYLNSSLLQPYGRATALRLDTSEKTIHLELELKGETSPVQIDILNYDLREEGGKYFASASDIRTSREWLTKLAQDRVRGQRFEIPAQAGSMLVRCL